MNDTQGQRKDENKKSQKRQKEPENPLKFEWLWVNWNELAEFEYELFNHRCHQSACSTKEIRARDQRMTEQIKESILNFSIHVHEP